MRTMSYPTNVAEFREVLSEVEQSFVLENRLPQWVFEAENGALAFCQYPHVVGGGFATILAGLASAHGDEYISAIMLDPDPYLFFEWYGCYPVMRLNAAAIEQTYWQAISFEPHGDVAGAPTDIANTFAIVGDSGRWAVWGERRWDLGVLRSDIPRGSWLESDVPFVSAEEAIEDFTAINSLRSPAEFDRQEFLRNYRPPQWGQ